MPISAYFESLYIWAIYNFGFSGENSALPAEVGLRLLDFYILFGDLDKSKVITLMLEMIKMKQNDMMAMEAE